MWDVIDAMVSLVASFGLEVFIIVEAFSDGADTLTRLDCVCLPVGSKFKATAGFKVVHVWFKTDHLSHVGGPVT